MDKYEYKLKTEQMLELMEDGAYDKAAEIADTVDWKRVRNVTMLTNVSDIYEKNREYQKSYDVLNIAYHRAEGSRKVIYRLCTLALKTGNVDEAIDYYDDFMQIAPKDPNQHILRYQILRAQRAPVEQQIEALEEFKKAEYIEEWAYELAKLYQEAGMTAECLEECDDLILWFSEGQYVYKAMELKMQYKPLTPSQQEKYDHRYEKLSSETEEMPNIIEYSERKKEAEAAEAEEGAEAEEVSAGASDTESDGEVSPEDRPAGVVKKSRIGSTMRLDEALQKLLHPSEEAEEKAEETGADDNKEMEVDEIAGLEDAIDEIESVVDLNIVKEVAQEKEEKQTKKKANQVHSVAGAVTELTVDDDEPYEDEEEELLAGATGALSVDESEELSADELEELPVDESEELSAGESEELPAGESKELTADEAEEMTMNGKPNTQPVDTQNAEDGAEEQVEGQMSFEDIFADWENQVKSDSPAQKESAGEQAAQVEAASAKSVQTAEKAEPKAEKKAAEPILPPDIQRMIDEIEGVIPVEEEKPARPIVKKAEETPRENMGKVAEELRIADESEDFEDYDDVLDEDEYDEFLDEGEDFPDEEVEAAAYSEEEEPVVEEAEEELTEDEDWEEEEELLEDEDWEEEEELSEDEDWEEEEELLEDEDWEEEEELLEDEDWEEEEELPEDEDWEEEEELPEDEDWEEEEELLEDEDWEEEEELLEDEDWEEEEELPENEDWEEDDTFPEDELEEDNGRPDLDEEFRPNPAHSMEPDDREIPDDDDDEMDILSATTPLSRKETAKLIATGKTAPLPLDEISDALSMSDTGFVVHGRYDLATQSGIGTRAGLTEEQKKLFSYFVPVRGMSEQLVDVLEQDRNCTNREGTSRTGNLLIIGNKGNGKTVLAVDVVKAIQKQRNIRQGKVAIVTGDSLNKKKISDIFGKLYGGALIIEKAGKMNEKTVARLNKAMERDTGELLIVLEEQRKPLDRLLSSNREFRRKFTCRLEVPIFINDELVTFGQTYAQENGYRIDEMGILALYSKIDSLQREDHAVTVAEVKDIMDEAMQHSQKASAKKLVKRVFGKNTDDADRILLSEKDFNV